MTDSDELMTDRGKTERNERLFLKDLSERPDDVYLHYKYGDFLRRMQGRDRDARDLLERCLHGILAKPPSIARGLPYAGEVAALCALEYARQDQIDRAREIVDIALRRFLATPNLHYIAASLALEVKQNDAAIEHYRRCLAYRGQVLVVPIQEGITSHVSLIGIAQALMQKGDFERGKRLLSRALELAADDEVGHLVLSRMELESGDPGAALQTLTSLLARRPDSAGACQQAAWILRQLGRTNQARRLGAHALELLRKRGGGHGVERMETLLAACDDG